MREDAKYGKARELYKKEGNKKIGQVGLVEYFCHCPHL